MNWELTKRQVENILDRDDSLVTNLANVSAALNEAMQDINWVGFYIMENGTLKLGPFQGKVACTKIAVGKGVCGNAVKKDEVLRVFDVHEFPGHIACDSASASEIVLPLHKGGSVFGVLDIDSPLKGRFSDEDERGLKEIAGAIDDFLNEKEVERRRSAYENAIMVFHITINGGDITHFEGRGGKLTFIPFGGEVSSDMFTGKIRPGAADVQVTNAAGIRHMQAKYVFEGVDGKGNKCHLFVDNNGYFEPERDPSPFMACPTFMSDSPELEAYLGGAHFRAEGYPAEQGVDILIFDTDKE